MGQSRIENSIKNAKYSIISYFCMLLLQFVNRTLFIRLLTNEYLGLNGLFANILNFLSLAELGVGQAINYALYKPLQICDEEKIKSIMSLYQKMYRMIGCVILILGSCLTPFLSYLISDMPQDMSYIYWYYLLYVLNSGISYFFAYKRSIIISDQKEYIVSAIRTIFNIVLTVLQVAVLIISGSYMFYLIMAIAVTVGENLTVSAIANHIYPYLTDKNVLSLSLDEKGEIKRNVMAMLFHKIGGVIVFSTDNIIISKFVGLTVVGIYSNYTLITSALNSILGKMLNATTAGVGNLAASESKGHVEAVFDKMLFANFWMRGFCAVSLFCLFQTFITLWLGEAYLLTERNMLIIVINFYINGMRNVVGLFRDATGVFWYDRYKPLIESAFNILFSIPLAIRYGVMGVLLGTLASTLVMPFWYEGYVLYKYLFGKSVRRYIVKHMQYAICVILAGMVCHFLCNCVLGSEIAVFLIRCTICLSVPNIFFVIFFRKTEEYGYFLNMFRNVFHKRI